MKSSTDSTLTSATYEELVREMIVRLGEDPDREGLVSAPRSVFIKPTTSSAKDTARTPKRCSKARYLP